LCLRVRVRRAVTTGWLQARRTGPTGPRSVARDGWSLVVVAAEGLRPLLKRLVPRLFGLPPLLFGFLPLLLGALPLLFGFLPRGFGALPFSARLARGVDEQQHAADRERGDRRNHEGGHCLPRSSGRFSTRARTGLCSTAAVTYDSIHASTAMAKDAGRVVPSMNSSQTNPPRTTPTAMPRSLLVFGR